MQDVSRRVALRLYNATNSLSILVKNVKNSLRQAIPSSVWTRKKELIGNFKNAGRQWCKSAELVLAHEMHGCQSRCHGNAGIQTLAHIDEMQLYWMLVYAGQGSLISA
jgi:hypothetical protein